MPVKSLNVALKLGFLEVGGEWEPNDEERKAAWEMYVELVTRISVAELRPDEGLLREALTSLHSLFGITREILRRYGPVVAGGRRAGTLSFGYIAVAVLNGGIRPFLATWHPSLADYESQRGPGVSVTTHEASWERSQELRQALSGTRKVLVQYAWLLSEATDCAALMRAVDDTSRP